MQIEKGDYEHLRSELESLSLPINDNDRKTLWVVDRVFGIAKTVNGAIEIFLVGEKVNPVTSLVRRHLEYGQWQIAEDNSYINSNRIVLPAEPHFLPLAAMIGVELVRFGLTDSSALKDSFRKVEPLIELALRQAALGEEHILGLIGELLCLEVMLDAVVSKPDMRGAVLDMWMGHSSGLRDFTIGDIAIEVKTTRLQTSSHKFTGLHQVEPDVKLGSQEKALYLLSIGLAVSDSEGQSLSSVVQRIVTKLFQPTGHPAEFLGPLQKRFLRDVSSYGSENSVGYDHLSMSGHKMYNVRFRATFPPRLYDLIDTEVRIIRKRDLEGTCVSSSDLQFRLDLETTLSPINPVPNWTHTVSEFVRCQFH